jgi:predicted Zn-dependent protease
MASYGFGGRGRGTPRSLVVPDGMIPNPEHQRFLSQEQCRALADRVFDMTSGGGNTSINIGSFWHGNVRWGRNAINTAGDTEETNLLVTRVVRGAGGSSKTNASDDATLRATEARAEAMATWMPESPDENPVSYPDPPQVMHPHLQPTLWFEGTYNLTADARAAALTPLLDAVQDAGFTTSGYAQIGADGTSVVRSAPNPVFRYYPRTTAQFSLTVRDPKSAGSGWAGIDYNDWTRIDVAALGRIALDKCRASRNPVAIEPGRYMAILEPQAVCDLFMPVIALLDRQSAERGSGPFANDDGTSKIGERVLDERITVGVDPMDPDAGFVPFDDGGEPYRAVNWIEHGVLKALSYSRRYAITRLQTDFALPNPGACRMSGGTASIDDMITTTQRGVLVTRFSGVQLIDQRSVLVSAQTRDGLWLIEHGKISKPIKNFRIAESPLFALNNVEQLGVPQRVFHPSAPVIVPPVKVRDFSFAGLMDAV